MKKIDPKPNLVRRFLIGLFVWLAVCLAGGLIFGGVADTTNLILKYNLPSWLDWLLPLPFSAELWAWNFLLGIPWVIVLASIPTIKARYISPDLPPIWSWMSTFAGLSIILFCIFDHSLVGASFYCLILAVLGAIVCGIGTTMDFMEVSPFIVDLKASLITGALFGLSLGLGPALKLLEITNHDVTSSLLLFLTIGILFALAIDFVLLLIIPYRIITKLVRAS